LGAAAKDTPFGGHPYEGKARAFKGSKMFHNPLDPKSGKFWTPGTEPKGFVKGNHPEVNKAIKAAQHAISETQKANAQIKADNIKTHKTYTKLIEDVKIQKHLEARHLKMYGEKGTIKNFMMKGYDSSSKESAKSMWRLFKEEFSHLWRTKEGATGVKSLRPLGAFSKEALDTGASPMIRQIYMRTGAFMDDTLKPLLGKAFSVFDNFVKKANPVLLTLDTLTLQGSTYDITRSRSQDPQVNIDKYTGLRDSMFTTEGGAQYYQQLIDLERSILEKMPNKEIADGANQALVWADDGAGNSLGINLHNPEVLTDTSLNIAADAAATAKQGVRQLISSGEVNTRQLASSFATGIAGKAMDKAVDSIWDWGMTFFAKGGIAPGGFRAFANGGTVSQPTLGLVGEGKYNEAVVPLPDGKSIPVIGSTGGDNNVTVNVTVDSNGNAKSETQSGMDGDQAKQLGYMISQAVQSELVEQQRPGGLLSQY